MFFQISKKKEPLPGLLALGNLNRKFCRCAYVFLCWRAILHKTSQVSVIHHNIMGKKTEKTCHSLLRGLITVSHTFSVFSPSFCMSTSVNLEKRPHWGFSCRLCQLSVNHQSEDAMEKAVCFLCCIPFSLHITVQTTEEQRKILGRWALSWASPQLTKQTVVLGLSF